MKRAGTRNVCFFFNLALYIYTGVFPSRGGSRGRVEGVRTPPWDDLQLSNTTGILQKKVWFIGVQLLHHSLVVHPLLRKFLDPPLPPFSLYKFVHFFFSGGYACILNSLNGKTFDRNYQTADQNWINGLEGGDQQTVILRLRVLYESGLINRDVPFDDWLGMSTQENPSFRYPNTEQLLFF